MDSKYKKETDYTDIPNWWRSEGSFGWEGLRQERIKLAHLYPSIWFHEFEEQGFPFTYKLRILFNDSADEAQFILRESL